LSICLHALPQLKKPKARVLQNLKKNGNSYAIKIAPFGQTEDRYRLRSTSFEAKDKKQEAFIL